MFQRWNLLWFPLILSQANHEIPSSFSASYCRLIISVWCSIKRGAQFSRSLVIIQRSSVVPAERNPFLLSHWAFITPLGAFFASSYGVTECCLRARKYILTLVVTINRPIPRCIWLYRELLLHPTFGIEFESPLGERLNLSHQLV